jgi:outer membrane protein assembly factor BamB
MRQTTAALLISVSLVAHAGDGNWPRFRGPNGTGLSDATTVPVQWTDKDYNWKVDLPGQGHSSPVVWDKHIYVTSGDRSTATRIVLCLDTATGKTHWQRDYPSKSFRQHRDNSYASASPAADAEGVVVTWSTPEQVVLLALKTDGSKMWLRELGPYVGNHGTGSSPVIAGDLVVLANDQEDPKAIPSMYGRNPERAAGKSFLLAVDRRTGETRWQVDRPTRMSPYSTPCVSPGLDGRPELIFTSTLHGITAVDVASGTVNWQMDGIFKDRCVGSPVVTPGLVIAGYGMGSQGDRIVALRPGSKSRGVEPTLAYDLKRPVPLVPTPLVKDGRLYLWNDNGSIACHDVATGRPIWRERVRGSFYGSPVWVAGRLYCISKRGEVFVVAASDTFKELARVPLGEPSFATPAVANGVMYLRTRSRLYSLGGGSRRNGPRPTS